MKNDFFSVKKSELNYDRTKKILDEAVDIANEGDLEKALPLFIKAYELSPMVILAAINVIQCLINMERYSDAIPYIENAEESIKETERRGISPEDRKRLQLYKSKIYTFRGVCLYGIKSYKAALNWFDKALEINSDDEYTLEMKEMCESVINDPRYNQYTEYEKMDINNADYQKALKYHKKGVKLSKYFRYNKALVYFERAYKMFPKNLDFCIDTGQCLVCMRRYKNVLEYIDKCQEIIEEMQSFDLDDRARRRLDAYIVQWYMQQAHYYYYFKNNVVVALEIVRDALNIGEGPYIAAAKHMEGICKKDLEGAYNYKGYY